MIEHNKNFYSLEELKRTKDNLEGYLDNEEVYYFVGAIRYACDEIERLHSIIKEVREYRNVLYHRYYEKGFDTDSAMIIKELDKILDKENI